MQLSLRTFSTLVQDMAAAVQASATQLLDLSAGSALRAILEANASMALWLQWLILQVLRTTRAATSNGSDLDSWAADFSLVRLPAVAATGIATLSRFTPVSAAIVPAGAQVRTADGTQIFLVSVDELNPAWAPSSNGYVIAAGVVGLDVPVIAQQPGSAGNVLAGTVSLLATAMPGVDSVSNAGAFRNGADAETDEAFRSRFRNFISSRSRATPHAVGYAVSSIQQGLNYAIQENLDHAGGSRMGSFVVTIDDGSGCPSTALLTTVQSAIEAVRPIGSIVSVRPPELIKADVALSISVADEISKGQIIPAVGNAIGSYINSLPIGASLPLTRLAQVAYSASPSVINVSQLLVNGSAADVVPSAAGVVKVGIVAVN